MRQDHGAILITAISRALVRYVSAASILDKNNPLLTPYTLPNHRQFPGRHVALMGEAEIKSFVLVSWQQNDRFESSHAPFVSLISGGLQVVRPISLRHAFPYPVSTCISRSVVELGCDNEDDVISY